MQEVKLFGQPSAVQQSVKLKLEQELIKANLDVKLLVVQDAEQFIEHGIGMLPSLQIGSSVVSFDEKEGISTFVQRAVRMILLNIEHGHIPQIIVPTDFSDTSKHAFAFAAGLAKRLRAIIKVVHVYFPVTSSVDGIVYIDPEVEKAARSKLSAFREEMETKHLQGTGPIPFVQELFLVGHVSKELEKIASRSKSRMIVMGTVGEGDTFKKFFGSVSVAVATHASCPVFVIPPEGDYRPFRRVLYGSEDPVLDERVVSAIRRYTGSEDSALDVVHLHEGKTSFVEEGAEVLHEDEEQRIKEVILFKRDLIGSLIEYAEREDIDLIVMERKNRGIWGNLFHQSATRKMTIRTKLPLLVLHEKDLEELPAP